MSRDEFGSLFAARNNNDGHLFKSWIFEPGMAYGDLNFWWPTHVQKRPRAHEGIDFFCYEDGEGKRHFLTRSLLPAPCSGRVVALCPDFLGHSVFVRPENMADQRRVVVFAHIVSHVKVGQRVELGDIVGTVGAAKGEVPGHLHVSSLVGDMADLPVKLSWPALLGQSKLQFCCPFF